MTGPVLRCWGTRGNLATPEKDMFELGGNTSCYELRIDQDQSIVLDCGTGLIEYARHVLAQGATRPRVFHIVVSHFHWDHLLGFPFFHLIHVPGTVIHIYSCFDVDETQTHVRNVFDGTYSPLQDLDNLAAEVHFHRIAAEGTTVFGARIRGVETDHGERCYATRIDTSNGSLAYVTDHEARPSATNDAVIELARGVDVLLHDAQFTPAQYPRHVGWGHSNTAAALANGEAAGAGLTLLTHHDPGNTDRFLTDHLEELRRTHSLRFDLAREGVDIPLRARHPIPA